MAESLEVAGVSLAATAEEARGVVTASGGDPRRFTVETLPQTRALVAELNDTAGNLRRMSETLEGDPRAIRFGPPAGRPGPGEKRGR